MAGPAARKKSGIALCLGLLVLGAIAAYQNNDYLAVYRVMTIDPGRTQVQFEVKILGDTLVEGNETFNIIVYNVMNAVSAKNVGVGTIIDADVAAATSPAKAATKGKGRRVGSSRSH